MHRSSSFLHTIVYFLFAKTINDPLPHALSTISLVPSLEKIGETGDEASLLSPHPQVTSRSHAELIDGHTNSYLPQTTGRGQKLYQTVSTPTTNSVMLGSCVSTHTHTGYQTTCVQLHQCHNEGALQYRTRSSYPKGKEQWRVVDIVQSYIAH